jgi:hypothetical protein
MNSKTGLSDKINYSLKYKKIHFTLYLAFLILFLGNTLPENREDLSIRLRWNQAFPAEKWQDIQTGMIWALSHLGAELPQNSIHRILRSTEDPMVFETCLDQAQFPVKAQKALAIILAQLKKTEEYQQNCSIDLGRFIVLTLHAPHHYYEITDMPKTYTAFRALHEMDKVPTLHFPVVRSSIAVGNRIVEFRTGASPLAYAFIAAEGTGRLEFDNFNATEFEVFDVMKNGQLRFGIYDNNGQLEACTPPEFGEAGKPGNCMWCHESTIQPLFSATYNVPGNLTKSGFLDTIFQLKSALAAYQNKRSTDIQFAKAFDHTYHELLYITFMEPSAQRISNEWNISIPEVEARLKHLKTHRYSEYPWMGVLYDRADIDRLTPFATARVPDFVRAPSAFEPNYFLQ